MATTLAYGYSFRYGETAMVTQRNFQET